MRTSAASRSRPTPTSLAFLVWVFALVAFGGTTILGWHPIARAAGVLLFGVPVITWAVLRWRAPLDRLDAAVLFALLAHLVVSFVSRDPLTSLEMSAAVATYAATFWLARRMALDARLRRLTAMAVAAAICFWLVVLAVTWLGEKLEAVGQLGWPPILDARQPYVWGSINTAPVLAMLVGPFIAWLPPGGGRRTLTVLWLASSAVVVPFSVGRAGWLGIAVALASLEPVFGFPVARRVLAGIREGRRRAWVVGGAVVAATVGVFVVLATRGPGLLASALDSRIRLWEQAVSIFADDPVSGAGPSTFGWVRFNHVADYVDRVAAKDVHSVPLQTLSDGGVVLLAAFAAVVVAWASIVLERRSMLSVPQRLSIAALIGYAAVALLDDLSFLPSVTVMLIMLAAWSIPASGTDRPRLRGRMALTAPAALLVVAIITAPAVLAITASRVAALDGRRAAVSGDWQRAASAFGVAANLHGSNALHWMSLGLTATMAGASDTAMRAYEQARSINPGDPRPWGALAVLTTDDASRISLLDEAARRSNDPRYAYRLGLAFMDRGDPASAGRAFAIAAALQPDWVAIIPDAAWGEAIAALPEAIRTVGSIGGHRPEEAWWNAGLASGSVPADASPAWRAVAAEITGEAAEASALLQEAREREPNLPRTDQAAAAVARLRCDREAYDRAQARLSVQAAGGQERGHPVGEGPAGVYREPELGDYQPLIESVPEPAEWPLGLIEVPDCGW